MLDLVGRGLIEDELGNGVGLSGIDVRGLVEAELDLRGSASGRPMGEVEMAEDGLSGRGGSVRTEMILISPPQVAHRSGRNSKMRARSWAHRCREDREVEVVPLGPMGCRALGGSWVGRGVWVLGGGLVRLKFSEGSDPTSPSGVRGQDPVVAVPMHAWRRDELCEALQELKGRENQDGAVVGCGPRRTVDESSVRGL